ncbi:MAG TPA: hypothetical protein VIL85_12455 [Thermomicrobiales bacterium]
MSDLADEQQGRGAHDGARGRVAQRPSGRASIAQPPPVPDVVRWRGSAHEYDFGTDDSTEEVEPTQRWRESAHEYDFSGNWD